MADPEREIEHRRRSIPAGLALLLAVAARCAGTAGGSSGASLRVAGQIAFETYRSPVCGDAGPSPLGRCSRESCTGDMRGRGDTAIQSMTPIEPAGLLVITENEVLHPVRQRIRLHRVDTGAEAASL